MGGDETQEKQELSFESESDMPKGQRHRILNENNEFEELTQFTIKTQDNLLGKNFKPPYSVESDDETLKIKSKKHRTRN